MKYDVYFEIYGKKMKATVEANSEEDAKYLVRGKIKFHKVVEIRELGDIGDFFNGLFR